MNCLNSYVFFWFPEFTFPVHQGPLLQHLLPALSLRNMARVAFKKVELCCFNPHLRCSQTLEIYRDWYRSWVLNQEYFATLIWRCWCCSMVCSLGMFGEIEILFVRFILPRRNDASCTAWNIVRPFKLKLTLHVEMTLLAGLLVIYNSVCMLWFEFTYVDQFIKDIECWHIMLLMCRTITSKIWTAEISWGQVWLTWGCHPVKHRQTLVR